MDPRIEDLVGRLFDVELGQLAADSRETQVQHCLASALAHLGGIERRPGVGVDGSTRRPDAARVLPSGGGLAPIDLAIEYKLYRARHDGAGGMDRALGQCVAYAEKYDAVLLLVVYMGPPEHPIPKHWLDRFVPLRVGHSPPGVPIYFAARPQVWNEAWPRHLGS